MCKVFMMPGITDEARPKAEKFVREMAKIISQFDEDGVGYAGITAEGKVFGEKWVNKVDAFQIHNNPEPDSTVLLMQETFAEAAKFKDAPKMQGTVYGAYGDLANAKKAVAVMLHARKKTIGDKSVENTHPFFQFAHPDDVGDTDVALIHNGSIANHAELTKVSSTCDSEVILHEYVKNAMNWNPWAIEKLAKTLVGEYAVGVLTSCIYKDGSIVPILDVFKSHKELYVGWIEELGTHAFCTSEINLETGAKAAGLTVKHIMEINSGCYMRFDAVSGERLEDIIKFELSDRGYNYHYHSRSGVRSGGGAACEYPYGPNVSQLNPGGRSTNGTPPAVEHETVEDVKRNFQRNHSNLFTQGYVIPQKLTAEEKSFYAELEKDSKTNHKALRLVASVLSEVATGS